MQVSSDSYGLQELAMPMFILIRKIMPGGKNQQRQEFRMLALFLTLVQGPACLHASNDQTFEVRPGYRGRQSCSKMILAKFCIGIGEYLDLPEG